MPGEIKDVLVLLDGAESSDAAKCGLALHLAQPHEALITGLYIGAADEGAALDRGGVAAPPASGIASSLAVPGIGPAERPEGVERRFSPLERSRQGFDQACGASGQWALAESMDEVLQKTRCSDLVISSQANPEASIQTVMSVDELALQAGRPLLILPYVFHWARPEEQHIGSRVLIAWNGSSEASRAVHDALPFLRSAEAVTILAIGQNRSGVMMADLDRLRQHLSRHRAKATIDVELSTPELSAGDIILNRVADLSCDLLVMGAYSRGRLRESWFGGASRDLFQHMTVPVLTAH